MEEKEIRNELKLYERYLRNDNYRMAHLSNNSSRFFNIYFKGIIISSLYIFTKLITLKKRHNKRYWYLKPYDLTKLQEITTNIIKNKWGLAPSRWAVITAVNIFTDFLHSDNAFRVAFFEILDRYYSEVREITHKFNNVYNYYFESESGDFYTGKVASKNLKDARALVNKKLGHNKARVWRAKQC